MLDLAQASTAALAIVKSWLSNLTDSSTPLFPSIPKPGECVYFIRSQDKLTTSQSTRLPSLLAQLRFMAVSMASTSLVLPSQSLVRCRNKGETQVY